MAKVPENSLKIMPTARETELKMKAISQAKLTTEDAVGNVMQSTPNDGDKEASSEENIDGRAAKMSLIYNESCIELERSLNIRAYYLQKEKDPNR